MSETRTPVAPVPPLNDRYGNTLKRRRGSVIFIMAAAAAFVLAFTAWVVWAGLDGTSGSIEAKDTAHTVIDEFSVEVKWDLTVEPGTAVTCAVQALNAKFAVVGWSVVDIPPSDLRTRALTDTVRTTELASTGLINRCWLT